MQPREVVVRVCRVMHRHAVLRQEKPRVNDAVLLSVFRTLRTAHGGTNTSDERSTFSTVGYPLVRCVA
jgi:hypothetical protein